MLASNAPAKIPLPFANAGTKNTIPTASQIAITPGAASLTDGFPPLTRTPIAAGGVPPFGADMNGILFEISANTQWENAGGFYPYDAAFSTAIGGYRKGAVLARADLRGFWLSLVDNNATNPDTGGAGWSQLGRILLTANATFFVSPTGNDSNNGLTTGTAFLTIQGAINALASGYDLCGFAVTVSVAAGTYAGFSVVGPFTGQASGNFTIAGAAGAALTSTAVNGNLASGT